jgi:hypothetical protein
MRGVAMHLLTLIPVLVMVALDPRRRAGISSVAYGLTLLAVMTWTLTRSPAYASMAPATGMTLIALIVIVLAAVAAAFGARALSATLAGPAPIEQ